MIALSTKAAPSAILLVVRSVIVVFAALTLLMRPVSAQIAPGATQSAARTANINGIVTQSDGKPVAGAEVQLIGPSVLSAKSDSRGTFHFGSLPFGTYLIVVNATGLGQVAHPNLVINGDIDVAIQYSAKGSASGLKTIAQVSTRSAGIKINSTSSSINSINPSDYAFQGNASWTQLFAQIPGVAASGYSYGGATALSVLPGAPQQPVVLSLNGALPYETSTTLDGMPLQGASATEATTAGGGVDLSNLPLNAFDAADVVRGPGANAPSIVDSIGGSFVLHAPGQVPASHFEYSASNDPYGGIVSNAKVALRLGRLSTTLIYGVNDSPGPLGTGTAISALSSTPATINGKPVLAPLSSFGVPNPPGIPNCGCAVTDTLLYSGVPQSTAWSAQTGAAALSYNVGSSIVAQVFYAGSTSHQAQQGGYYPVSFAPLPSTPAYNGSLAPSPVGQATYSFLGLGAPSLSNQSSSLLEEKITAYFGGGVLRLAALQYNSFTYSNGSNSLPNGQYTLWGTAQVGSKSPGTTVAYNGTPETLTFTPEATSFFASSSNRDLLASYAIQVGSSSSAGISHVTSYYNNPYSIDITSGKTPLYSQNQPSGISSTTNETRVHWDSDLNKLSLGLSWYFANGTYHVPSPKELNSYADSSFPYSAPRFGAVWRANPDISIRASAGGGFALPTLANLTGYSLFFTGNAYTESLPNLDLKPEETFGFDLGTDMRFHRDTVLSFDLYRTNLYGQFFSATTVSTFKEFPLYITQIGNLGSSRYEGINLNVRHDVPNGYYWSGTFGLTRGYVVSVPPGFYSGTTGYPPTPCTKCVNQYVVPGANFNSAAYSASVPYASASADVGYRWTPGRYLDLSSTYYGNNNIYNTPKVFVELDAHAGYAITKNVSLLATLRNITAAYDAGVQTITPGYAVPVVAGAPPYGVGAAYEVPYGPRAVIVTVDFKY